MCVQGHKESFQHDALYSMDSLSMQSTGTHCATSSMGGLFSSPDMTCGESLGAEEYSSPSPRLPTPAALVFNAHAECIIDQEVLSTMIR